MSVEEALDIRERNLGPNYSLFYKKPLFLHKGYKQWLFDVEGNKYLDCFAGIATVSVGHCHPKLNAALEGQMKKLWHTTNLYLHSPIHEYAEKLTSKMPGNLKVCIFVNSGTEANELAVNMMRAYTGKWDVICHRNSYHGCCPVTASLTSDSSYKFQTPSSLGIHPTSNPDVFRGCWGGTSCRDSPVKSLRKCSCSDGQCSAVKLYIDQLEDVFNYSVPSASLAGFIVEPVQGAGGIVQYPRMYLKEAFKKIRSYGGLCILDEPHGCDYRMRRVIENKRARIHPINKLARELPQVYKVKFVVQTGFGRLGTHYWAFESMDIVPDIVTLGKGIANGFPLGVVVTTPEIASVLTEAITFNTYGGNPMACTVASATMDVIDEEKLLENCAEVGTYFLENLATLRDEYEIIGDVRGKGLMIGVEIVENKETNKPLAASKMDDLYERTKENGLIIGLGGTFGNVFRIKPPLCISKSDVDIAIGALRKSLKEFLHV